MPNLFIDLDTDRFVRENSWCVGLRGINGTEGESLDGFLNVIRSGSLVAPSSLSLSINNADNDYLYNSGTFASGNYFTLPFQSFQLREDLAGRPSTYGLLVAKVNLSGENFSINPLSTQIFANPTGNNTDAIYQALNSHISDVSNPHNVTAAKLGLGNIQTDLNSVSGEINGISDNLNIVSGEVLEIQEYLELIQPFTGVSWNEISGKPLTFSPSAHTHPWNEITSQPDFALTSQVVAVSGEVDSIQNYLATGQFYTGVSWSEISGKPLTFAPSAHTHPWGEVTDKPTGFAPVAHTHGWNDVTGKPTSFVMTTGNQDISGSKTFINSVIFSDGGLTNAILGKDAISFSNFSNSSAISIDSTKITKGIVPQTIIDFLGNGLSGDWSTNTIPTQSGHLINKGYLETSSNYQVKSGNFTGVANTKYLIDTSGAAFTGTLPPSPAVGHFIDFVDARKTWNSKNFTINRNSLLIDGTSENLTCDVRGDKVSLVYQGTDFGWLVLN